MAEAVLHAAFAQELPGQHCHMLEALRVPSLLATTRYGKGIATGLSAVAAYAMPYRVDGTPADTPEGLKMFQSESWPCQGSVDFGRLADDCDGQANLANQFIEQAKGLKASGVDMRCFPNLRAVANSIGAHYVHGMAVIAANAGHADAADPTKTTIAGHAITTLLPKTTFAVAMQRGARAKIDGAARGRPAVREGGDQRAVGGAVPAGAPRRDARGRAADARDARRGAPDAHGDRRHGAAAAGHRGHDVRARRSCTSTTTRSARSAWDAFVAAKESLETISPNILRVFKSLDACETGEHAFYNSVVESSFSPKHELFTSGPLRSMGAACCHVRHVQVAPATAT